MKKPKWRMIPPIDKRMKEKHLLIVRWKTHQQTITKPINDSTKEIYSREKLFQKTTKAPSTCRLRVNLTKMSLVFLKSNEEERNQRSLSLLQLSC